MRVQVGVRGRGIRLTTWGIVQDVLSEDLDRLMVVFGDGCDRVTVPSRWQSAALDAKGADVS